MIDWEKLANLYPEEWEAARETHSFANSDYGIKRRKELEAIISTTKDDMVATINSGEPDSIELARAAASLIEGLNLAIGVLYQNDLLTAEGLLASEELTHV
jgi:hypothetical protein